MFCHAVLTGDTLSYVCEYDRPSSIHDTCSFSPRDVRNTGIFVLFVKSGVSKPKRPDVSILLWTAKLGNIALSARTEACMAGTVTTIPPRRICEIRVSDTNKIACVVFR